MQKNFLLITVLIIVLVTGFFVGTKFYNRPKTLTNNDPISTISAELSREPNNYKNDEYGFSFQYPFNLQLNEASSTSIIVGTINDLETVSEVELKVFEIPKTTIMRTKNATESAAIAFAKNLCDKTSNNIQRLCESPDSKSEMLNENSDEFYFQEKLIDTNNKKEIYQQTKGPFIIKKLNPKNQTVENYLLIHPPLEKEQKSINTQLIRDISASIILHPIASPSATPE